MFTCNTVWFTGHRVSNKPPINTGSGLCCLNTEFKWRSAGDSLLSLSHEGNTTRHVSTEGVYRLGSICYDLCTFRYILIWQLCVDNEWQKTNTTCFHNNDLFNIISDLNIYHSGKLTLLSSCHSGWHQLKNHTELVVLRFEVDSLLWIRSVDTRFIEAAGKAEWCAADELSNTVSKETHLTRPHAKLSKLSLQVTICEWQQLVGQKKINDRWLTDSLL